MIFRFTEYRDNCVRIPARMAGIPIKVWKIPVTRPAVIPAKVATKRDTHTLCPLIIIMTQTAPPVHMVPSTVRSAMSRTRNVRYTPIAIIPQIRPWAAAPGSAMIKFAICMSLSSCMRDLFAGACLKKTFSQSVRPTVRYILSEFGCRSSLRRPYPDKISHKL